MRSTPQSFGYTRTRWTLQMLMDACRAWRRRTSLAALWRLLKRLRIRYRRGQEYLHSPDPDYVRKRQRLHTLYHACAAESGAKTGHLLFLDEVTYQRQPTPAPAWQPMAEGQPHARLSHRSNDEFRIVGVVDAHTGRVMTALRRKMRVATLRDFFVQVCAAYPAGEPVYVVVDNWPVHYHPDLLAALGPQPYAGDFITPSTWTQTPRARVPQLNLPIVLVPLPTYSPWLNAIEKLWGASRRKVTHMHTQADDLDGLKARLRDFFDQFRDGSDELLTTLGIRTGFNC